MASNKITLLALLFLVILTYSKATLCPLKEIQMTLYYKDYAGSGPNATTIEVPGPPSFPLNFTRFGALFVSDIPIYEEFEECSTPIARGQAFEVIAAQFLWVRSVKFIKGKYKGSTLQLQGTYSFLKVSELAVVGGTKIFRGASGYARFKTVYYDPATSYAVFQSNMTVYYAGYCLINK